MGSSGTDLPEGDHARPASLEDLPAIDEVCLASERALGVLPEPRTPYLRWLWSLPHVDVARDTRLVQSAGTVVGFAMATFDGSSSSVMRCMGRVHPAHLRRGIGGWMLAWFQERARATAGATTIRVGVPERDDPGHGLLGAAGYERARTSFDMGTGLNRAEVPPEPPAGITIRRFVAGADERTMWQVETEAFRDHWDHEHDPPYEVFAAEWFGDPNGPARIWLAEADGSVVGECGWVVDTDAYVGSLGVLRPYRGRGIGTTLLRTAMADAAAAGHARIVLSVDAANPTGALQVYERAGLSVLRTLAIYDRALA